MNYHFELAPGGHIFITTINDMHVECFGTPAPRVLITSVEDLRRFTLTEAAATGEAVDIYWDAAKDLLRAGARELISAKTDKLISDIADWVGSRPVI